MYELKYRLSVDSLSGSKAPRSHVVWQGRVLLCGLAEAVREVEEGFDEFKKMLRQEWEQLKRDVPGLPQISLEEVLEDHPERGNSGLLTNNPGCIVGANWRDLYVLKVEWYLYSMTRLWNDLNDFGICSMTSSCGETLGTSCFMIERPVPVCAFSIVLKGILSMDPWSRQPLCASILVLVSTESPGSECYSLSRSLHFPLLDGLVQSGCPGDGRKHLPCLPHDVLNSVKFYFLGKANVWQLFPTRQGGSLSTCTIKRKWQRRSDLSNVYKYLRYCFPLPKPLHSLAKHVPGPPAWIRSPTLQSHEDTVSLNAMHEGRSCFVSQQAGVTASRRTLTFRSLQFVHDSCESCTLSTSWVQVIAAER